MAHPAPPLLRSARVFSDPVPAPSQCSSGQLLPPGPPTHLPDPGSTARAGVLPSWPQAPGPSSLSSDPHAFLQTSPHCNSRYPLPLGLPLPPLHSWFTHVSPAGQAAPPSTPQGPPLATGRNALMFSPPGCSLPVLPIWVKSTGVPASTPCPSVGLAPDPEPSTGGRRIVSCCDAPEKPPGGGIVPNFAQSPPGPRLSAPPASCSWSAQTVDGAQVISRKVGPH